VYVAQKGATISISTRIMVLQSSDCCWHHDYCVVLVCVFLGLNQREKYCVLQCLHYILPGYRVMVGFYRAMIFPSQVQMVVLATAKCHSVNATSGYCMEKVTFSNW